MSKKISRLTHPVKARKAAKAQQRNLLIAGVALDAAIIGTTTYAVVKGVQGLKNKRARRASDNPVVGDALKRISQVSMELEQARYELHKQRISVAKFQAYRSYRLTKRHLDSEYRVLDALIIQDGNKNLDSQAYWAYQSAKGKANSRKELRLQKKEAKAAAKYRAEHPDMDDSTLSVVPEHQVS